jgi:hypothetical protein
VIVVAGGGGFELWQSFRKILLPLPQNFYTFGLEVYKHIFTTGTSGPLFLSAKF